MNVKVLLWIVVGLVAVSIAVQFLPSQIDAEANTVRKKLVVKNDKEEEEEEEVVIKK